MKFIHIADVHFDMPLIALSGNRELIKKRRTEQRKAFHEVIQYAKKENVDAIFIAGDLFEQKFVEKSTIDYIISNFQLIPEINIFIAPGNHDPFIKNSPYGNFNWPDNVTIFKSEYGMINLEEADIYGVGFEDYEMSQEKISEIKIENEDKINILITHGTLNGTNHQYHDIKEKELKKFDYVALGHIHEKKVDDSNIIYPGSLLSCGFDEPGKHGFVYGEITKEQCKIEFKELDYKNFEKIELDISNFSNFSEAFNALQINDDIYEIKLVGVKNFNVDELIDDIKDNYQNVCKIKDNTRLGYDFDKIKNDENLKGVFTRKMLEEIEKMSDEEKTEAYKIIEFIYELM